MSKVHEIEATVDIGVKVQLNYVDLYESRPNVRSLSTIDVIAPLGPNNQFHVIFLAFSSLIKSIH